MKSSAALLLIGILICGILPVSAVDVIPVSPDNTSAVQLGGLYTPYTFSSGTDTINVFSMIPLTLENSAFPLGFWNIIFVISFAFLIIGILLASVSTHIPSMGITACGLMALGGFAICAFMAPYTASIIVSHIINPGTGGNTVYVTESAVYVFSPQHAQICWGLFVAGFVEAVLGTLSFFGYFLKTGQGKANKGEYMEHDGEDGGYRGVGKKLI